LAVLITWVIGSLIGFTLAANIFRLGMQEGFELYGAVFTLISALGLIPFFLGIGLIVDRARRGNPEGR
jgi:hypothetical protein